MSIELGDVILDEKRIYKQLRYDMRDDWFPDPRAFKDLLETGFVAQTMLANFAENHGQYIPGSRNLLNIPKPDFTLRYALETGLPHRVLYHGLVAYLVPFYDALLPWNVCSHRHDRAKSYSSGIFKPHVQAWRDFVGVVRSAVRSDGYLVSTDISNYYENVDLDVLQAEMTDLIPQLEAKPTQQSAIRAHLALLFRCLKSGVMNSSAACPRTGMLRHSWQTSTCSGWIGRCAIKDTLKHILGTWMTSRSSAATSIKLAAHSRI